jgi:branched-chain amino acid transport system ATP-binding protein
MEGSTSIQNHSPLLSLEHVAASYGSFKALYDVTLHVNVGEVVTLIGANGAGKTTTLRLISGLLQPQRGTLRFQGNDLTKFPPHEIVERGISHVPEGRQLFPYMTVAENLTLGAYISRARPNLRQVMEEQFDLFPILAERRSQMAGTLSGGEQQMVAIARALMSQPKLLLLDEPSLGLAPNKVEEVFERVRQIRHKGVTVMLVEQNVISGLNISDRGYVVQNGVTVLNGSAKELLANEEIRSAYFGYFASKN